MTTPILTDGSADRAIEAPRVVLPTAGTFAERARRFAAFASSGATGGFFRFMAALATAQDRALALRRAGEIGADALARSRDYGMPPLVPTAREPGWRDDLASVLDHLGAAPETDSVLAAVARLRSMPAAGLEEAADRLIAGSTTDEDATIVPFIGAALQVSFTRLAATLRPKDVEGCDVPTICPACGTRPVASVVRIGGNRANLRYLICSLCATETHMTRIQCSFCEEDKGLKYFSLDAEAGGKGREAWRAEACDECHSYLKIFYQEKDPALDPFADDLASLALDVLMDERGYLRSGPNLLFHPGTG